MSYVYAFFASFCFGFLYNVRGKLLFTTALGGALCRLTFDLFQGWVPFFQFFIASMILTFYGEYMARVTKTPVMIYVVIGFLPIVPGAGVYNTMSAFFYGDMDAFIQHGSYTMIGSGAIALAIIAVSSTVRIFKIRRFPILRQFRDRRHMPRMK